MPKNDTARPGPADLMIALALLTRLPLPKLPDDAFDRQAKSVWAFPIVGAVIAFLASAIGMVAIWFGLPATVAAGLILAVQIISTGAMHEDGAADTADGLWGGWTRERRLEIMKDSAIGTYGVLALILSLGLRWSALTMLIPFGFGPVFAAAILSRAALPVLMTALPHARADGLSHQVGVPGREVTALSLLIGFSLGWLAVGPIIVLAGLVLALFVTAFAFLAKSRIGGQTGDILGAAQQLGENGVLLALLAGSAT